MCAKEYLKNSKCNSKTQISQPSHQFHDQFKRAERERERERERGTWKGAKRARFDEQIEIPGACLAYFRFSNHTQSFESERKLKRKEENQREKAIESGNEEWW